MMEKLKKYQVFVYLILIILIMGTVKIKYGENEESRKSKVESLKAIPTMVPTAVPTAEATPTINPNDDYPLWRLLPYKGEGFTVDKYIAPMTLEMTITTATESAATKEVTVWLNSFKELKERHKVVIVKNSKP